MSKKQVSRPDFPRTPDSQWLTNQAKTDRCHRWSNVMFPFLKEPVYLRQSFIFRPQKFRGKISGEASPPGLPSSRRSKDIWCETRAKAAPESQLPGSWTSHDLVGNGRMVVIVVIIVPHSSIPYQPKVRRSYKQPPRECPFFVVGTFGVVSHALANRKHTPRSQTGKPCEV